MPDLTPSFVMKYERRMRAITENEYIRRLAAENTWWPSVSRTTQIEGASERITWLLNTAFIEPVGPSGTGAITFENLVSQTVDYPSFRHAKGISVTKDQIEDLDGTGLNILADWSMQIGNETAYYPQRLMAQLILNGANTDGSANAYDGVPFFADNTTSRTIGGVSVIGHPVNPYRPQLGGYSNWLKGASSGAYPGAVPIDYSQSVDVALQNLSKAISYVAGFKMPNGVDPRFLSVKGILAPPYLAPRLRQLTDAKFIAQAASSGGGSGDVMALIQGWGLGKPMIAPELGSAISYTTQIPFVATTPGPNAINAGGNTTFLTETLTGSDTTYYLICEENNSTQLGGLLYVLRKPFRVTYYTGDSGGTGLDAILDRANTLEYHVQGRMSAQYGHPYTVIRCDAS